MKIIHTADNHLDMPLAYLPPEKARVRKRERWEAFSEIINYAIREKAAVLLISGDLFDSPSPSEEAVSFCRREFERLGDIPVCIALGNHDYGIDEACFPGNVHIFPPRFKTLSFPGFSVTGASFSQAFESFEDAVPQAEEGCVSILCLHGDIYSQSQYNPLNKDFLSSLGYDYIALGHIHQMEIFPRMAYPGCHDGGGFDETGVKGFLDCQVDENICKIDFVPSSYRIYDAFSFDVTPFSSTNAIINALEEKMEEGLYKITLTGNPGENFSPNLEYIKSSLSQKAFFVKLSESYTLPDNFSESSLYCLFAKHISENAPEKISQLALSYGKRALKGEDIL